MRKIEQKVKNRGGPRGGSTPAELGCLGAAGTIQRLSRSTFSCQRHPHGRGDQNTLHLPRASCVVGCDLKSMNNRFIHIFWSLQSFWWECPMLFFGPLHSDAYIFPFLLCFLLLFFSQLFVRPPQTAILLFCISFPWGWS